MNRAEAEKLITVIRELAGFTPGTHQIGELVAPAIGKTDPKFVLEPKGQPPNGGTPAPVGKLQIDRDQLEAIYRELKNRILDDLRTDPVFLKLLAAQPEILIEIEPRVVELQGSSLKGRVARLLAAGWFDATKATSAARRELARTGADPGGGGTLSDVLTGMVRDGFLVRAGDGYQKASGVKVTEKILEAR